MASDKHFSARIVDRRVVAEDLFLLRVDPGGKFPYLAGQYATLGVETDGKPLERPYSICSSPYEELLEFFVERVAEGALTPRLYELQEGSTLLLRKFAKGRFTLDLKSGRKNHLLLSTVTGVAPFLSYIRTVYTDSKKGGSPMPGEHRFFCLQGASKSVEFGYREELEKYAGQVNWLRYVTTVSRPWDEPTWQGERGRVDDLIRKYVDLWGLKPEDTTAYLCGNPNMVENGKGILARAGWAKAAMQDEIYFVPGKEGAA